MTTGAKKTSQLSKHVINTAKEEVNGPKIKR